MIRSMSKQSSKIIEDMKGRGKNCGLRTPSKALEPLPASKGRQAEEITWQELPTAGNIPCLRRSTSEMSNDMLTKHIQFRGDRSK